MSRTYRYRRLEGWNTWRKWRRKRDRHTPPSDFRRSQNTEFRAKCADAFKTGQDLPRFIRTAAWLWW